MYQTYQKDATADGVKNRCEREANQQGCTIFSDFILHNTLPLLREFSRFQLLWHLSPTVESRKAGEAVWMTSGKDLVATWFQKMHTWVVYNLLCIIWFSRVTDSYRKRKYQIEVFQLPNWELQKLNRFAQNHL